MVVIAASFQATYDNTAQSRSIGDTKLQVALIGIADDMEDCVKNGVDKNRPATVNVKVVPVIAKEHSKGRLSNQVGSSAKLANINQD